MRYIEVALAKDVLSPTELDEWREASGENLGKIYIPTDDFGDYNYRETEDDDRLDMTPIRIWVGEYDGKEVHVFEMDAVRVVLGEDDVETWISQLDFEDTFS